MTSILEPDFRKAPISAVSMTAATFLAFRSAALTVRPYRCSTLATLRSVEPSFADGELVYASRILDTAPFVFGGEYADGCLTRVSTATLVNVTAGGGSTVPTFIVEKR